MAISRTSKTGAKVPDGAQTITPGGVFISHVHEDESLAEAFALLINDVSAGSIPTFRSTAKKIGEGIQYGEEWFRWICESVEKASHIVALITPSSVGRPWILFEAGLGKAKATTSVFGVGLGISREDAYKGPFAVLQNCGSEEKELVKLCRELVAGTNANPRDEIIVQLVGEFRRKVDDHFASVKGKKQHEDPTTVAVFQALEEMKLILRDQSRALESELAPRSTRRPRADHLMFVLHSIGRGERELESPRLRLALLSAVAAQLGHVWVSPVINYLLSCADSELGDRENLGMIVHDMFRAMSKGSEADHLLMMELDECIHRFLAKRSEAQRKPRRSLADIEADEEREIRARADKKAVQSGGK